TWEGVAGAQTAGSRRDQVGRRRAGVDTVRTSVGVAHHAAAQQSRIAQAAAPFGQTRLRQEEYLIAAPVAFENVVRRLAINDETVDCDAEARVRPLRGRLLRLRRLRALAIQLEIRAAGFDLVRRPGFERLPAGIAGHAQRPGVGYGLRRDAAVEKERERGADAAVAARKRVFDCPFAFGRDPPNEFDR